MDLSLLRILIIYQDSPTIDLLRQLLTAEGCSVEVAKDAESGLRIAQQSLPDLIILDVELKPIDGMEICKAMRMVSQLKNTFITFFTRLKDDVLQVNGLNAGADDFIIRPVSNKVLTYRIQALFRRRMSVKLTG